MTIEEFLDLPNSLEARAWLQGGTSQLRTLGELPSNQASIDLVDGVYELGAKKVTAIGIVCYEPGDENTGKIVVTLPDDKIARERLFNWCAEQARAQGFDPEEEVGQEHLFVSLD